MPAFTNPVIPGFAPDPSVVRVGGDFFLVTSSFEFSPGVPVYHSTNLANWSIVGYCLRDDSLPLDGCRTSGGVYAPTIRYHRGIFYMTTTNTHSGGNLIVHTDDVSAKWSDPVFVDVGGIDPSLFFDGDKCYFISTAGLKGKPCRRGIHICEIDPVTGVRLTDPVWISSGTGGRYPEGPHLYRFGDWYYLLLAEGGTAYGHAVTLQRSRDVYGPYEPCPTNPVLTHRDLEASPIEGVGHADLVEDQNGNLWAVCLGFRPVPGTMLHHLGRETFLVPVKMQDGWLVFGENGHVPKTADAPLPADPAARDLCVTEDFTAALSPEWNTVRGHDPADFSVGDGVLTIRGRGSLSEENGSPSFIGVRQRGFSVHADVTLRAPEEGATAGICAYYGSGYHYEAAVRRGADGLEISLRRRVHGMETETAPVKVFPEFSDRVTLSVEADAKEYTFIAHVGGVQIVLGRAKTCGLATEGTETVTYTGVYIGLYAEKGDAEFEKAEIRFEDE